MGHLSADGPGGRCHCDSSPGFFLVRNCSQHCRAHLLIRQVLNSVMELKNTAEWLKINQKVSFYNITNETRFLTVRGHKRSGKDS